MRFCRKKLMAEAETTLQLAASLIFYETLATHDQH
jgi:hypothetical protein